MFILIELTKWADKKYFKLNFLRETAQNLLFSHKKKLKNSYQKN